LIDEMAIQDHQLLSFGPVWYLFGDALRNEGLVTHRRIATDESSATNA
jgi:hypothetical protein